MATVQSGDSVDSKEQIALVPTISFKALQRARTTLEDFAKTYFLFHDLNVPEDFFRFLDVLVYVEGTIYQLDEVNEEMCRAGTEGQLPVARHIAAAQLPAAQVLQCVLRQADLLDERIEHEIQEGLGYWERERSLTRSMSQRGHCLLGAPPGFTEEQVLETHRAKSFDYRVLNLLLFKLRGVAPDEAVLGFLRVDEMLVDMGDDLVDYEDDVEANSFNIYRAFIHLHGREAELRLVERISRLESQHKELLSQLPSSIQEKYKQRQLEAGQELGSDKWSFPPPIYDEARFRKEVQEVAGACPR